MDTRFRRHKRRDEILERHERSAASAILQSRQQPDTDLRIATTRAFLHAPDSASYVKVAKQVAAQAATAAREDEYARLPPQWRNPDYRVECCSIADLDIE